MNAAMNKSDSPLNRVGPWIAWGLVLGVAGFLFSRSEPMQISVHNKISSGLNRLKNLDDATNLEAYALRFQNKESCDGLTDTTIALVAAEREVERDMRRAYPIVPPELTLALRQCSQTLQAKLAAFEQFKSDNAVLSNSRIYFPRASGMLIGRLYARGADHKVIDSVRDLETAVMRFVLSHDDLDRDAGFKAIGSVSKTISTEPSSVQGLMTSVILHARMLLSNSNRLTVLLAQAVDSGSDRTIDRLYATYAAKYNADARLAWQYRTTLGGVGIAVVVYALWAHTVLRRNARSLSLMNDRLELRVLERTNELDSTNKSLVAGESRIRALVESLDEIVVECSGDGVIINVWANDLSKLLVPKEQMIGATVASIIGEEAANISLAAFSRVLATGQAENQELMIDLPSGKRWYQSRLSPVAGPGGTWQTIAVLTRDVTERKEMERQLTQSQKLEAIGQLAAGIAHEINTPIQYVGDNARFLLDSFQEMRFVIDKFHQLQMAACSGSVPQDLLIELDKVCEETEVDYLLAEIPVAIGQSLDGIERVANIVRAMKDFSHPGTAEKSILDLNQAVETTVIVARNEWKYVAELVTELDPELPSVYCFPGDINQVLLNLIVNAAHAISERNPSGGEIAGRITVSTHQLQEAVEIRINDTGTGIPVDVQPRIFDPFFTTKGVGRGTGQGLSIAHDIVVKKHGGYIGFETTPGTGTTFVVRLPLESPADSVGVLYPSPIVRVDFSAQNHRVEGMAA